MSDWGWVTFGYLVVYGTIAGYAVLLGARHRRTARRLDGAE